MSNPVALSFWTSTHSSSRDDTWTTPRKLWATLNREFQFNLDAAALSSSTLVPENWYGPDHPCPSRRDALTRCWAKDAVGAAWVNPPYGRRITGRFVAKAAAEAANGLTVVCLVPSRTDTSWWHNYVMNRCEIRFLRGRLKFGNTNSPAPFPSAVLVYRPNSLNNKEAP